MTFRTRLNAPNVADLTAVRFQFTDVTDDIRRIQTNKQQRLGWSWTSVDNAQ
jgi:hypothetical protein